jgi:type IV secretory pathway protease TraF
MKVNKRELRNVTTLVLCVGGFLALFPILELRVNLTSSHVPVGFWRAYPVDSIDVGDVIAYDVNAFRLAEPDMYEERLRFSTPKFLKRVAALPGAWIERSGDLVLIDGKEYSRARIVNDSWCHVKYPLVVPEGSVWLMADAERAWDSRYHGPLPINLVREKNKAVLVWGEGGENLPRTQR